MGSDLQWRLEARTNLGRSAESYGANIIKGSPQIHKRRTVQPARENSKTPQGHQSNSHTHKSGENGRTTSHQRKRQTLRAKPGFARPCAIALWHACVWPECFGSTMAESKEERGASLICRAEGVLRNAKRDEDVRSASPGTSAEHAVISEKIWRCPADALVLGLRLFRRPRPPGRRRSEGAGPTRGSSFGVRSTTWLRSLAPPMVPYSATDAPAYAFEHPPRKHVLVIPPPADSRKIPPDGGISLPADYPSACRSRAGRGMRLFRDSFLRERRGGGRSADHGATSC